MEREQIAEIDKQIKELERKKKNLLTKVSRNKQDLKFYDYIENPIGRQLIKRHKLDEYGVWKVEGEDPNADLYGVHVTPLLGYFEGTLEKVIRHAVYLKKFWTWGAGGTITKVEGELITKL